MGITVINITNPVAAIQRLNDGKTAASEEEVR